MHLLLGSPNDRSETGRIDSEGDDIEAGKASGLRRNGSRRKFGSSSARMRRFFTLQYHSSSQLNRTLLWLAPVSLGILALLGLFTLVPAGFSLSSYGTGQPYGTQREGGGFHPYPQLQNLVMVAGHAVYTSTACDSASGEGAWFLEDYQKHAGMAASFVSHIEMGVTATAQDPKAMLLFSGGETRKDAGPRSEAQSYWSVAESSDWFGVSEVRQRALTEEHARDSFENLLFSICRFRELTGHYPHNITVVSYDFKKKRFAELHRSALAWPAKRFQYLGTPPAAFAVKGAIEGEAKTRAMFQEDPYGCRGTLHKKREQRDPFARTIPYPSGCPELQPLFQYCGTSLYPHRLPWDAASHFL